MDKMFDSSFRYGVFSFLHNDTSSRVVVSRVRLAVLRSRLIASGVRLVILSVQFVDCPLRFVVLGIQLITDHIASSLCRLVVSSWRFIVSLWRVIGSTRPLREATIRLQVHNLLVDSMY